MEYQNFSQQVESLLFSTEFKELQSAIEFNEPNIWHILGISRKEILMSKFLAWMLNPNENHSLKDKFLNQFFVIVLQKNENRDSSITPLNILLMDFFDADVRNEYWLGQRRVDILIIEPEAEFLCIIENKIGAKEAPQQTSDYYKISLEEFPVEKYPNRLFVYLTPDGDPAQDEHFISLSYRDVLLIIDKLLIEGEISGTDAFLLTQFHENILRGIAMDQKTIDLAQSIYQKYKEVFDFIYETVEPVEVIDEETIDKKWDGKSWFFNCGETNSSTYRWVDYKRYSFIIAGGGTRYRDIIKRFKVGDVVYTYLSGKGYVGIGTVTKTAVPFRKGILPDGRKLTEVDLEGSYNSSDDYENCEWIALVDWQFAVNKDNAVREEPVSRATAARIYEHRMGLINKIRAELITRSSNKK